ncbi:MAG: fasciclin domain-containing protein [Phycisphaerales bacterium]
MATGYLCALIAAAATTFGVAGSIHSAQPDIVTIAAGNDQFETLVKALTAAELVDDLQEAQNITVLAPVDGAFDALDQRALRATIENDPTGRLADVLRFHVIPERLTAAQLASRRFVTTLDGERLEIGTDDGLRIGGAGVLATDIAASNGIIHVIDAVLIPAKADIAQLADDAGLFRTLLAAAEAAGLAQELSSNGPITLFAPTDEAFAKLGSETIASLLEPENRDTLADLLRYHAVIGERLYAEDLIAGARVETAQGQRLSASVRNGEVFLDNSRVVRANLDASNGVIHVIDRVLMPQRSTSSVVAPAPSLGSVEEIFALAIERGAPLFNDHQPAACAAVYEVAIASALALEGGLDGMERARLGEALDRGRRTRDAGDRAWIFRRAMDDSLRASRSTMSRAVSSVEVVVDARDHH